MNNSLITLICFLPLIVIFIAVKVYLLLSESSKEINYIKQEAKKPHGPYIVWDDEIEDEDE